MNLFIILAAKYLFLVSIIVFLLYLVYLWNKKRATCFSMLKLSVIYLPITLLIAKISSKLISDPRPFVVEHIKPLIVHIADNGFPSDHMLLTMTLASIVFIYNRKLGIALTIIAIGVGTARVLAKVHHVEDIIGSTAIAVVIAGIVYFIGKRFFYSFFRLP